MDIIYGQFLVRKQISSFFARRCALRTIFIFGVLYPKFVYLRDKNRLLLKCSRIHLMAEIND